MCNFDKFSNIQECPNWDGRDTLPPQLLLPRDNPGKKNTTSLFDSNKKTFDLN